MLARQSLIALAIALLVLQGRAHGTIYFGTGFDLAQTPASAGGTYGWSIVGSPTLTSTVEALPGNLRALRLAPASGGAQYLSPPAWSAASSLRVACRITPRATGGGSCTREVFSLVGSGGDWSGKAAILAMRAAGTGVTLQAFYGDIAQKVCSGSPALGKQCTTVADCPELRPGEAQCAATAFAASPVMTIGTPYVVTLAQDNGSGATAGTTTLGLYQGAAGAAYSRGGGARIVGECSGGTNDLAPCNVASECPMGTCAVSNVVAPTTVRFGASDTVACAPQFDLDSCWVYDGTVVQNWRWETLLPSSGVGSDANWSVQGAANAGLAVDDGASPDSDTTYVYKESAGSGTRIDVPLSNPATPLPTPIVGVVFEALAKDNETTSGRTMDVRLDATDGTNRVSGTHATTIDWGDDGASAAYYAITPEGYTTCPDGAACAETDLNSLQIAVNRSATTHTTNSVRVTSLVAGVIQQTADPVVPTTIKDRDQDGEDTVCFVGDSTWDNVDFQNAIVANLVEPTNIYFYTRGGSHLGDAAAEWDLLLEGTGSTYLGLTVAKGTSGKTCDLVFVSHTVNWVFGQHLVDPKYPTAIGGLGQEGYCEMQGAAGQGDACWCPTRHPQTTNLGGTPAPNITPGRLYCVNSGRFRQTPAPVLPGYCGCSSNADCTHGMRTPGGLHTPAPCNTTFSYCGTGSNHSVDASALTRAAWAMPGCIDAAGCTGGVCVHKPMVSDLTALVADLTNAAAARPTPNPAATPSGTSGPPIVVWVAAPHLAVKENVALGTDQTTIGLDRARALYRRQPYFVDLLARFRQRFPESTCAIANSCTDTEDATLAIRDGTHWTLAGQLDAALALAECASLGGADGVCTGGICTVGLAGDTCSVNADCDLRRCP